MSSPRLKYRNSNLDDLSGNISPSKSNKIFVSDSSFQMSPMSAVRRGDNRSLNYSDIKPRPKSAGTRGSSPKLKQNQTSPSFRSKKNSFQMSNNVLLDASKRFKYLSLGPIDIFRTYTASQGSKESITNYPQLLAEYMDNADVIIFIEHCSDCSKHNDYFRHDENKYIDTANMTLRVLARTFHLLKLNIRLGVLRVRLSSDKRLGAFEVCVMYLNRNKEIFSEILHSKIVSHIWPDINSLQDKLKDFIYKSKITKFHSKISHFASVNTTTSAGSYPVGFGPWSETKLSDPLWAYTTPNLTATDIKIQWVYDSREAKDGDILLQDTIPSNFNIKITSDTNYTELVLGNIIRNITTNSDMNINIQHDEDINCDYENDFNSVEDEEEDKVEEEEEEEEYFIIDSIYSFNLTIEELEIIGKDLKRAIERRENCILNGVLIFEDEISKILQVEAIAIPSTSTDTSIEPYRREIRVRTDVMGVLQVPVLVEVGRWVLQTSSRWCKYFYETYTCNILKINNDENNHVNYRNDVDVDVKIQLTSSGYVQGKDVTYDRLHIPPCVTETSPVTSLVTAKIQYKHKIILKKNKLINCTIDEIYAIELNNSNNNNIDAENIENSIVRNNIRNRRVCALSAVLQKELQKELQPSVSLQVEAILDSSSTSDKNYIKFRIKLYSEHSESLYDITNYTNWNLLIVTSSRGCPCFYETYTAHMIRLTGTGTGTETVIGPDKVGEQGSGSGSVKVEKRRKSILSAINLNENGNGDVISSIFLVDAVIIQYSSNLGAIVSFKIKFHPNHVEEFYNVNNYYSRMNLFIGKSSGAVFSRFDIQIIPKESFLIPFSYTFIDKTSSNGIYNLKCTFLHVSTNIEKVIFSDENGHINVPELAIEGHWRCSITCEDCNKCYEKYTTDHILFINNNTNDNVNIRQQTEIIGMKRIFGITNKICSRIPPVATVTVTAVATTTTTVTDNLDSANSLYVDQSPVILIQPLEDMNITCNCNEIYEFHMNKNDLEHIDNDIIRSILQSNGSYYTLSAVLVMPDNPSYALSVGPCPATTLLPPLSSSSSSSPPPSELLLDGGDTSGIAHKNDQFNVNNYKKWNLLLGTSSGEVFSSFEIELTPIPSIRVPQSYVFTESNTSKGIANLICSFQHHDRKIEKVVCSDGNGLILVPVLEVEGKWTVRTVSRQCSTYFETYTCDVLQIHSRLQAMASSSPSPYSLPLSSLLLSSGENNINISSNIVMRISLKRCFGTLFDSNEMASSSIQRLDTASSFK
eukprot:gene2446-4745_t